MGRKILLDGKITDIDKVKISPDSHALIFGCGFFETVLFESGTVYFLQDHIERLTDSCRSLSIPGPDTGTLTNEILLYLVKQNSPEDKSARIKIMYAPLFEKSEWVTAVFSEPYERNCTPGAASVCDEPRENRFYRHKTLSYMQNIILLQNSTGYDEVLLTNSKGNIIEGTKSNIIAIKDNTLYYVDNVENYLPGIMQKNILKDHKKLGFTDVVPVKNGFTIDFTTSLDELIMTNSLLTARNISGIRYKDQVIKLPVSGSSEKIRNFYISG